MPAHEQDAPRALSAAQIEQFIDDGFVKIERAFPRKLAEEGRAILWRDLPCDPDDPSTWTEPVVRLGYYGDEPFRSAVNTPTLHSAFDQLVGRGRWKPRPNLGTFPVRFPSLDDPGDAGWHIDVSFPGPTGSWYEMKDFSDWRANVRSRGRALLMLFLFSDVGENDAPTRIKVGSHRDVARRLEPAGEAGLSNPMLGDFAAAGSFRYRRSRRRLSLPSLPGACRADASRRRAAFHGAATASPLRAVPTRARGWWLLRG